MAIEFAKVLKKLRTEKGLSQRELADDMYVTRSTIARWENGSRLPDIAMIRRLSRCLGADINIGNSGLKSTPERSIRHGLSEFEAHLYGQTGTVPRSGRTPVFTTSVNSN